MTQIDAAHDEAQTADTPARGHNNERTYCIGCGKDMWEYSDEAKEDGWCITCAPECYIGGVHVAARDSQA